MLRAALVAVLLLATGCGAEVRPRVGELRPGADEIIRLLAVALFILLVGGFILRRRRPPQEPTSRSHRVLFAVAVLSVTATAALLCAWILMTPRLGHLETRILESVVSIAWGSLLLMGFLRALAARPSSIVARVGALCAVLQVPAWLVWRWADLEWKFAGALTFTFVFLSVGAAHATHVAFVEVSPRHRWLRTAAFAIDVVLFPLAISFLWFPGFAAEGSGKAAGVLLVLWVTVTLLLGACRRLDPVRKGASPSPVLDLVRHCIDCGSTRVVLDAAAGADVVRCEACGTRFVASSRPQAP